MVHFKVLEKQETAIPQAVGGLKIIKIGAEMSEMEILKNMQRVNRRAVSLKI